MLRSRAVPLGLLATAAVAVVPIAHGRAMRTAAREHEEMGAKVAALGGVAIERNGFGAELENYWPLVLGPSAVGYFFVFRQSGDGE